MDNLDVAVGMSTGGIVDERRQVSRLPTVLTVLAVTLPVVAGAGQFLAFRGENYDFLSGSAKAGPVLESMATTGCVSGLLVAVASFMRRSAAQPHVEEPSDG